MENTIKMDDVGVPLFLETPTSVAKVASGTGFFVDYVEMRRKFWRRWLEKNTPQEYSDQKVVINGDSTW